MSIHHLERAALLQLGHAAKKMVLMAICDDADRTSGMSMPGLEKLMQWGECGKSQTLAIIADLVKEGYLGRVEVGRKGRRAVYQVFARIACCAEHEPMGDDPLEGSGQPDPEPVDNPSDEGSGQPDPNGQRVRSAGPHGLIGSGKGSGLDRTPPVSPLRTTSSREVTTSRRIPAQPPSKIENDPPTGQGAVLTPRCPRHQQDQTPPPCGPCGDARRAYDQAVRDRQRQTDIERRERNAAAQAARLAETRRCTLCDDRGYRGATICDHDPATAARYEEGAARAREQLAQRRGVVATSGSAGKS